MFLKKNKIHYINYLVKKAYHKLMESFLFLFIYLLL
jgi:hypothetical protein